MPFFPDQSYNRLNRAGFPRQTLNHEQLLELCYLYKNLLKHLRGVQGQIDAVIDEFQHTQYGRPSEPLTKLLTNLANIDAGIKANLVDDIMRVEVLTNKWEDKSARLRAEAKRQRRIRATRKGLNERGEDPFVPVTSEEFTYVETGADPFAEPLTDAPASSEPPPVSPTMAIALRGMAQLPRELPNGLPDKPDTSDYKKSGLV